MELETGMTKEERTVISGALSKLLADSYVLYTMTQNFHWNVHGQNFFSLHKLSEEQYEELGKAVDEIAERIRALGFFVEATMSSFLKLTSIEEEKAVRSTQTYLEHLIKGHETVIRDCRALATLAEKNQDAATVDLMGRRLNVHEKALWMLRASI